MIEPVFHDDLVSLFQADCTQHLDEVVSAEQGPWEEGGIGPVALVTDPPYGIEYSSGQIGRYRDVGIQGDADTLLMQWAIAWAKAHNEAPAYVFGSWKRPVPEGTRAMLIWDKGMGSGMGDLGMPWKPNWESIYVLGKGHEGHRGDSVIKGETVVTWAHTRLHPNEKPVGLMGQLIEKIPSHYTIIDPFAGSCSTLVAAKKLGRRAIGFELESEWITEGKKRLAQESLFGMEALA